VPCSGAFARRGKVLDEVSAAIPGDAVAGNKSLIVPSKPELLGFYRKVDEIR
jgi:hypothetical protein